MVAQTSGGQPTGPVERKYFADGPSGVSRLTSTTTCDRKGNVCDVWYPTTIAAGQKLPIIVWANGSSSKPVDPSIYGYYLSHLASWGFIVVASRDGQAVYGDTALDALAWLAGEVERASSPIQGHADFARAGVGVHSQGAGGAINALRKSGGLLKTAVAYQTPAELYCFYPQNACPTYADLQAADSGSLFLVSGTSDAVATDKQLSPGTKLNSQTAYYNATSSRLLKAKGLIKGANHTDLLGKPDCASVDASYKNTCLQGVYNYVGLPTAWFAWQLKGDADAGRAFTSGTGEFFAATAWTG